MINVMTPERRIERLEEFLKLLNSPSKKMKSITLHAKLFMMQPQEKMNYKVFYY